MRAHSRLRKTSQFARVYRQQRRAGDRHLLVFAAPNGLDWTRFGLSVSKKHGNAVRRSRLKRLLREAFRLKQHDLPRGLDLVLIPRKNSGARLEDYQRSLVRLSRRLARKLQREESDNPAGPRAGQGDRPARGESTGEGQRR